MNDDPSAERTETDERVAENQTAATIAPASRRAEEADPDTGLPPGIRDAASPLDKGQLLDPFRGRPKAGGANEER